MFLGLPRVCIANGTPIGSAVFAQLTVASPDRQTTEHRQQQVTCVNGVHAMRPNDGWLLEAFRRVGISDVTATTLWHAAVPDARLNDLNTVVLEVVVEFDVAHAVMFRLRLVHGLLQPAVEPQYLHTRGPIFESSS